MLRKEKLKHSGGYGVSLSGIAPAQHAQGLGLDPLSCKRVENPCGKIPSNTSR